MGDIKLLVYPGRVVRGSKLKFLCELLNIKITFDIEDDFDLGIYWNLNPNQLPDQRLIAVSNSKKVINIKCVCVLKGFVDKTWESVSGYSITVDPANPPDKYVRKSQLQYISHTGEAHDGRVFDKPQSPDNGYVYQKLIDNRIRIENHDLYQTLRIPVFNQSIPCLYAKIHTHRFKSRAKYNKWSYNFVTYDIKEYLSSEEIKTILEFCRIAGVEYAELDILRDNKSGLIYVIDINNLAGGGIFRKFPPPESEEVQRVLAETFKKEFVV